MTKETKRKAEYQMRKLPFKNCGTCRYMLSSGDCTLVEGKVDRKHVCRHWKFKGF